MTRSVRRFLVVLSILATVFASTLALSTGSHVLAKGTHAHAGKTIHGVRFELIVKTINSPYWQTVILGAKKAAQQMGVQGLAYTGGPSEADINAEISLVENAIAKRPDFLVIASTSATALNSVINKAHNKGIKVIVIDSAVTTKQYDTFMATDNVLGGCLAAQTLAAAIKAKTGAARGQVAYATFVSGAGSLQQRDQGFRKCIAKYPGITIVAHKDAGGDPNIAGKALSVAADTLTAFPKLVGYWGDNLQTMQGAEKAFQEKGVNHSKVSLVGFDNTDQDVTALKNHTLDGTIIQDPYQMGYGGVAYGVVAAAGLNVPNFVNTGVHAATPANVNSPLIQALLNPNTQRGLGFK